MRALRLDENLILFKVVSVAALQEKYKVRLEALAVVEGINFNLALVADKIDNALKFFQLVNAPAEILDESFFLRRAEVVIVGEPLSRR